MTRKHSRPNLLIVGLLCLAFLLVGPLGALAEQAQPAITTSSSKTNYQDQIDSINNQMEDLKQQRANLEKAIDNAQSEREKEVAVRNAYTEELRITQEEIAHQLELIELLEADIAQKEQEITEKQQEYDENYALFLKRMRVMYMYDDATMLGLVLGVDNFSDFLTHTDTVVRIAQHDNDLMEHLTLERMALEQQKADLDAQMEDLEATRLAYEDKKVDLSNQVSAANLRIHDIDQMEKEYLADLEKNKALQAAMQAELDDIYKRIAWDQNPYIGGVMEWPLPGYWTVSSEYGYRFGGSDFHTGIDLTGTGVYGAAIVAANAGTVKFVNWTYTAGKGYGIYLIVDHGGGVTTLYAHCSNIVVSVGDVVSKGQKIAEVGSTGWSTGPHLHFEVRIDGAHVNPRPYIFG